MKYAVLLAGLTLFAAVPAFAQNNIIGFANASTYLHAGPGQDFPVVSHIPPGANINIIGCTSGYVWCDVAWNGNRGWISARFLDSVFNEQHVNVAEYGAVIEVPHVVFDQNAYWRRNYVTYPFYSVSRYWRRPAETPAEVRSERYNGVDE